LLLLVVVVVVVVRPDAGDGAAWQTRLLDKALDPPC
jgi:hypothetical protein